MQAMVEAFFKQLSQRCFLRTLAIQLKVPEFGTRDLDEQHRKSLYHFDPGFIMSCQVACRID